MSMAQILKSKTVMNRRESGMEEKSGVLIQNEKQANRAVAKVMRITFLLYSIVYLLNVFGIFVVDMKIMTLAYVGGSICLWIPTLIVNVGKNQKKLISKSIWHMSKK